ncbi:MAG: hypothetical protein Q8P56_03550 [Candidatus Uhrbacteria bacterium]|nr:hypothetical protein [Candidatus Uhrbacteria bacterium]
MLKEEKKDEDMVYQCEECGLHYREREWAEQCEAWCREHHTCNLEIIVHAVENEQEGEGGATKKI